MRRKKGTAIGLAAGLLVVGLIVRAAVGGPASHSMPTAAPATPLAVSTSASPVDPAQVLASASPLPPAQIDNAPPAGCGVERQALKVGRDSAARAISLSPQDTTIQALSAVAADLSASRSAPIETTVWRLHVRLLAYKGEADSDYHLVIADSAGNTMIAEIASPGCAGGTTWATQLRQTRLAFDARYTPTTRFTPVDIPVTIVGVGFFDFQHGQRGVAANGVELHPVLSITFS